MGVGEAGFLNLLYSEYVAGRLVVVELGNCLLLGLWCLCRWEGPGNESASSVGVEARLRPEDRGIPRHHRCSSLYA